MPETNTDSLEDSRGDSRLRIKRPDCYSNLSTAKAERVTEEDIAQPLFNRLREGQADKLHSALRIHSFDIFSPLCHAFIPSLTSTLLFPIFPSSATFILSSSDRHTLVC